jgi:hypothetical protein
MAAEQNYKNHGRVVPMFHGVLFVALLVNLGWAIYRLVGGVTGDTVVNLVLAVGLIVMAGSLRAQILTVQDRVIRLEMRHRFRAVLPADLAVQAATLPVPQIVALRFAGDDELPGLVREVLAGSLANAKAIKVRVRDWQPDHLRA